MTIPKLPLPLLLFLKVILLSAVDLGHANNLTNSTTVLLHPSSRPPPKKKIYTYYERIPTEHRTTGMSDAEDDELLEFWKQMWSQAGWEPVVLSLQNAQRHVDYYATATGLKHKLDQLQLDPFSRVLWNRWMAMAATSDGGWYADYDVFPLGSTAKEEELPNSGRMTVHDILSPTLATGSAENWNVTLYALLEDATHHTSRTAGQHKNFWTDSLGINSLIKNNEGPAPPTVPQIGGKRVLFPYDKNDPVMSNNPADCNARNIRGKWAVHFGPKMLQMAKHLPSKMRHPKYRLFLAQEWLPRWNELCETAIKVE